MNSNSQKTLRQIEQNDTELLQCCIGYSEEFQSNDASDYSRLGAAIGNNTHLVELIVALDDNDEDVLDAANTEFFDGLKRNSSINNLSLYCNYHNLQPESLL